MDENRKATGQIAVGIAAICLIIGALFSQAFKSDLPCGRVEKKYHGSFADKKTYQIMIRDKYYHVEEEMWKELNIGDLYCEK